MKKFMGHDKKIMVALIALLTKADLPIISNSNKRFLQSFVQPSKKTQKNAKYLKPNKKTDGYPTQGGGRPAPPSTYWSLQMKIYDSLFTQSKIQPKESAFAAFFPPAQRDFETPQERWDYPFKKIAERTSDGETAWGFVQEIYRSKYPATAYPKLRNYLNYTFLRLLFLEEEDGGNYFITSKDGKNICFNSGLQDQFGHDLLLSFSQFNGDTDEPHSDWVYNGTITPGADTYVDKFGTGTPKLAWYTKDSRDYIFNLDYQFNEEFFDHILARAKTRAGMSQMSDEIIKCYLNGVLKNLIPKIQRNYKVAIPVYYVDARKMQLLLPFPTMDGTTSAFLVDRDDERRRYTLKTILDMDQAYFAARLITRPDEDWLKP